MRVLLIVILILNTILFANLTTLTDNEKKFLNDHPIINVGVESNWPPFDFIENEQYKGITKDYLEIIEKKLGIKFNYVKNYSWTELLNLAKEKKIDLLPVLFKTEKREKYLNFTESSYIGVRDYLFSSNRNYSSLEDLKQITIAIPKNYAQEEFIRENYPDIKILTVNSILDAIDSVILKKADAFISNIALVKYLLNKHNISGIKADFSTNASEKLYMATRLDYPILRDIIDKALKEITAEEKNNISKKWIGNSENNISNFTEEENNFIKKHKKLTVANELDWIPYDFFDDNTPKGYVIDYIKLILNKIGIEPIFITDSWKNLEKRFKDNEINILPVISYNDKRKKYLDYTIPFISQNLSIVTKINKFDIINVDDLNYKKIGMIGSWNLTKKLKEQYPKIRIIEYKSLNEIFEAIKNNLIDATIQNSHISSYYINKNYSDVLKSIITFSIKDFDNHLYMGTNKNLSLLNNILNKSINMITNEEKLALESKWFNQNVSINFTDEEKKFIDSKIINVAYTDNWAPLSFVENNKAYGLGFDFWEYIVNKSNLKVNTVFKKNFTDALEGIKTKKDDIIITTSKTKDREKYSLFSDVYYTAPIGIATLQDKNYIPDGQHLVGKKVAVGKNYTAHKLLKKAYPEMEFVFVKDIKEGLELLNKNEIYALVDNMPVLTHNIQKLSYSNIKISGSTGINFNLQMMIRDDYKILQSIINKVLKTMTPSERTSIYNKWSKIEYTQEFDYSILWKYFLPLLIIIILILYKNRQLLIYQKNLKKTQKELEYTLDNFKTLVNLTIEGILIIKNEKIVFYNDEILKIFGLKKEELLNKSIIDLFEINLNTDIKNIISNSDSKTFEINAIKNNYYKFPTLVKVKNIMFKNQKSKILTIIDMSEIKNRETLLIQQSKMASLGEMIGNIAHQWRQPLSLITTAITGMKLQKEFNQLDDKNFNEIVKNITETSKFLSQTIDDFQNYLKEDKVKKDFELNISIKKILNILKGSFTKHSISVILDLENDLYLNGYENELDQAILNILNNSKDALLNIKDDDRTIFIKTYRKNDDLNIEIVDNAGGISLSIINRIFEPYFTTKHKSQGTGLGLYMTHNIITNSMKGNISILNTSFTFNKKFYDKCTKVSIVLPI